MRTRFTFCLRLVAAAAALHGGASHAFTFGNETLKGSFDSTISVGTGIRTQAPDPDLVVTGATGPTAPQGRLAATSGIGDQGYINYGKGDAFTTYIKGNHELLLKLPEEQITFMARANWVRDFTSTHTTGDLSGATPAGLVLDNGLTHDAASDLRFKPRLLDLWVSKTFNVGDEQLRVRAGNQVISWGESLFQPGGINSTNAIDYMRLSQPGTQLKEVFLPAPMVSVASGLGHGFNVEGYVQTNWNAGYFPPVGSYWSTSHAIGEGASDYGFPEVKPKDSGQWGMALRYQPTSVPLNLGLYAMNYHDKIPGLYVDPETFATSARYVENRKLYGASANFPLGDWSIGTELSYRPRDSVSLNPNVDYCQGNGGRCWVDEERYQWHLTGLYAMTPSNAGWLLKLLGADTATLLAEAVVIKYPGLKQQYGNELVSAGLYGWGQQSDPSGTLVPAGTSTSSAINFDFSWVYDGTLIPGWQVIPEVYYYQALSGRTPNITAQFMGGAKSINLMLTFVQNPANWQVGLNYSHFWGGKDALDQPYKGRDFLGLYLSRNF